MAAMRQIDIPATAQKLMAFIRATVAQAGFRDVVVAVSGGVDSAVAAALAAAALGPEHVYALLLPYRDWHEQARQRAWLLLRQAQIPMQHVQEVGIAPMVDAFLRAGQIVWQPDGRGAASELDRLRAGNIMARARMVVLFDVAKKLPALVLGTENKSEHYLGYYTRFGDKASDIEPLRTLYKTEVYALARHLGVPAPIIEAAPTAGLWQGQTDEGQFGFTYSDADQVLYGLLDRNLPAAHIAAQGIDPAVVEKVRAWVGQVAFKHHLPHCAPEPDLRAE